MKLKVDILVTADIDYQVKAQLYLTYARSLLLNGLDVTILDNNDVRKVKTTELNNLKTIFGLKGSCRNTPFFIAIGLMSIYV